MSGGAGAPADLRALIARVATGPKLSKDLAREEARAGLAAVLAGAAHPVQAAILLVALRMKRETDEENLGLLDAVLEAGSRAIAEVPELVDVSDPYDGFECALPVTPFLPALLAACGVPAVSHGVESVGPKHGLTHAPVLRAAGAPAALTPGEAAARIADPAAGWAYLDQSRYCPALHALGALRELMVKRTALSTLERVTAPLRARGRTHLLAGYVHVAYPPVYARLARVAGYASVLLVRGGEGGVVPSLRQPGQAWAGHGDAALEHLQFVPADAGIEQAVRAAPLPAADDAHGAASAQAAAEAGLAALAGAPGPARDSLVYAAALCLRHLGRRADLAGAAALARERLDDGSALARFRA